MDKEQNKAMRERLKYTLFYWLVGLLIVFGAFTCGVKLRESAAPSDGPGVWGIVGFVILCAAPLLFVLLQILKTRSYEKKLNEMDAAERVRFLLSHRENAEQTAAEKYRMLKRLHRGSTGTAVFLALSGAVIPFFAGFCFSDSAFYVPLIYALWLLFAALPRLDPLNRRQDDVDPSALEEAEYPALYKSLRAAATKMGYSGEIRVCVTSDCNAGIVKTKRGCIVELGVLLWYVVTPEELTAIFLHEFAHLQNEYVRDGKADAHMAQLERIGRRPFFPFLQGLFYSWFDNASAFECELFLYSVSLLTETAADDLMRGEGDAKTAASGLLKTGYYPYYEWSNGTVNTENPYRSEEALRSFVRRNAECFLRTAEANCEKWNRLIEAELLSRSATHPLLRDRLKKLGFETPFVPDFTRPSGTFASECEKAIERCSELLFEHLPQPFGEMKKGLYDDALHIVESWEERGKPLDADTYADVDDALRSLCRTDEANELCSKALETLSGPAALYANYALGLFLLHDFDPAGLPLVYLAAEGNSNYMENGFEAIGSFCCMMGLSDELEEFRTRSVAAAQKDLDFYSKMQGLGKQDDLSVEHLPDALQNDLLTFFAGIDEGRLQSVSVIRKTISPEYFTSPVIVRFVPGVPDETKDEIMHRVFMHLDACSDWQFSLYDYDDVAHAGKAFIDGAAIYGEAAGPDPLFTGPEQKKLTKKYRLNLAAAILSFVLLFPDIIVTVYLTGQREISDFSRDDWRIFTAFVIIAALLCLFMFLFAARAGRLLKERHRNDGRN